MGFYRHCEHGCLYDDPAEGRVRLDAPTRRELLTNAYCCWKCGERQTLDEDDRTRALDELLDRVEEIEKRVEKLELLG